MNFKKGDKVVVIAGKDKGKEGNILAVLKDENRVVVEGVNIVKKHIKANGDQAGSIVEREARVDGIYLVVKYVYSYFWLFLLGVLQN